VAPFSSSASGQGLSVRAAQAVMVEEHGVRRSRGAIWEDVAFYECPSCSNRTGGHADTAQTHDRTNTGQGNP
jgi:hypothetical protein